MVHITWVALCCRAVHSSRTVTHTDSSHLVPHPLITTDMTTPTRITSWSAIYTLPAPGVSWLVGWLVGWLVKPYSLLYRTYNVFIYSSLTIRTKDLTFLNVVFGNPAWQVLFIWNYWHHSSSMRTAKPWVFILRRRWWWQWRRNIARTMLMMHSLSWWMMMRQGVGVVDVMETSVVNYVTISTIHHNWQWRWRS